MVLSKYNGHNVGSGTQVPTSAGNTFSNFPNGSPQNFENSCRSSYYYDDGSANPAGFTPLTLTPGGQSGIDLITTSSYVCNPDSIAPRPAANYNQLNTGKTALAKGQESVIAPNPSSDGIFKLSGFGASQYMVTDVFGRKLASGILTSEVNTLDLSSFATGTYILTVQSEGQSPASYKLLRQ